MTRSVQGSQSASHWTEVAVDEPVTMINVFSVPLDESEKFLHRWRAYNAQMMSEQPGFVRAVMHKTIAGDEISFVNVAQWESGHALAKARTNPDWLASVKAILDDPDMHVTARPGVYQVVFDVQPGGK